MPASEYPKPQPQITTCFYCGLPFICQPQYHGECGWHFPDICNFCFIEISKRRVNVWRDKLQNIYTTINEFRGYNNLYGLVERLGFKDAQEAWEANPIIQGSVNPEDYKVVKEEDL